MDKKLTDKEIVKALECCMNGHCDDDCPFRETREHCHNLDSLILDLINRLQIENERLKAGADSLFNTLDYRLEQILKLEDNLKTAKTEAYKEFAERLKKESYERIDLTAYVEVSDIDNLLKELVGK